MKRILVLTISVLMVALSYAQQEHLKFMGIELKGTISEFQTKLQAKGLTLSPDSKQYPSGIRVYKGVFSGENAEILVWYNPRSKEVYRAKAHLQMDGEFLLSIVDT